MSQLENDAAQLKQQKEAYVKEQSKPQQLSQQQFEAKEAELWRKGEHVFSPDDDCMECGSKEKLLRLFSDHQFICQKCYSIQANWFTQFKNGKTVYYSEYDEIVEGIYLGNEDAAMDEQTFIKTGIKAVCAAGSYLVTPFQGRIQYKKYNIGDYPSQKIIHFFDENFEWMKKMQSEGKKILVHCAAGVSRSASFMIAFLMKDKNIGYEEARALVKDKRNIVNPNSGFVSQLKEYEKSLKNIESSHSEKKGKQCY